MNQLRSLDDRLFLAINAWARDTPGLHPAMLAYATFGVVLIAALLLAALVAARHRPDRDLGATGWAAVGMLAAVALNQPLGQMVGEQRPYASHPGILRLAALTTDFSFPSDHAVMAGAAAAGLLLAHRRLGALGAVAAVMMAFVRVYIGAHYPWDVLGGLLFGASVVLLGWLVLRTPLTVMTRWLRRQPGVRAVFTTPKPAPKRQRSRAPRRLEHQVGPQA